MWVKLGGVGHLMYNGDMKKEKVEVIANNEASKGKNGWEDLKEVSMPQDDEGVGGSEVAGENTDGDKDKSNEAVLNALREKAIEQSKRGREEQLAGSEEVEPDDVEKMRFGIVEVPLAALGDDKVLVDHLEGRSKFDVIGKKRDEKALWRLFDYDYPEENLSKLFTPTVAKRFFEHTKSFGGFNSEYMMLVEALPLEAQEELFKDGFFLEAVSSLNFRNESINLKMMLGLMSNLEDAEENYFDREKLEYVCNSLRRSRGEMWKWGFTGEHDEGIMGAEGLALRERAYNDLVERGANKAKAAVAFLDGRQVYDKLEDLLGDENLKADDAYYISELILRELPEGAIEKYYELAPDVFKDLSRLPRLWGKTVDKAEEVLETLSQDNEIIDELQIDEDDWLEMLMHNGRKGIVEQIRARHKDMDEEEKKQISRSLKNRLWVFVENYDEMRRPNKVFLRRAEIQLGMRPFGESETFDPEGARRSISEYVFGKSMKDLEQDLVALGLVKIDYFRRDVDRKKDGRRRVKLGNIDKIVEESGLSNDDRLMILEAIALLGCSHDELRGKLEKYGDAYVDSDYGDKLGARLDEMRMNARRRASERYGEYMCEKIRQGARSVGMVESDGKEVEALKMEGDEFMLFAHRLGAYRDKDKESPEQWNEGGSRSNKSVGYISVAPIAPGMLHLAGLTEKELGKDQEEVFYNFSELGDTSIVTMCEQDSYTYVEYTDPSLRPKGQEIKAGVQDFFYEDPRDLIKTNLRITRRHEADYKHAEVSLDRYSGDPDKHGGRLQPSQIIVFTDDINKIGDLPKKHAAYFGIPILMVDPKRYK